MRRPIWSPNASGPCETLRGIPMAAEQVLMGGAVLVRACGKRARTGERRSTRTLSGTGGCHCRAARTPGSRITSSFVEKRLAGLRSSVDAVLVAGGGIVFEAMLFRVLLDATSELGLAGQRFGAMAAVLVFSSALLLLELPGFAMCLRIGRQVETRLRIAFLEKIPKLGDRYFRSRLTSDMAERSHAAHRLRQLPDQVRQLLRAICEFCATAAGIIWLDPSAAPIVISVAICVFIPAFAIQSVLAERDLRVRSHTGALTRFYLDAMLGLLAIRAHGAERSVRREQEKLLGRVDASRVAPATLHSQS